MDVDGRSHMKSHIRPEIVHVKYGHGTADSHSAVAPGVGVARRRAQVPDVASVYPPATLASSDDSRRRESRV
eukprot:6129469-Prymnesium_polylepis.1